MKPTCVQQSVSCTTSMYQAQTALPLQQISQGRAMLAVTLILTSFTPNVPGCYSFRTRFSHLMSHDVFHLVVHRYVCCSINFASPKLVSHQNTPAWKSHPTKPWIFPLSMSCMSLVLYRYGVLLSSGNEAHLHFNFQSSRLASTRHYGDFSKFEIIVTNLDVPRFVHGFY